MKTLMIVPVEPVMVDEYLPEREGMLPNKIYISEKLKASSHLCLCGCGHPVFIPLTDKGWSYSLDAQGRLSMAPSLAHRFECKSHYIITKNNANFV